MQQRIFYCLKIWLTTTLICPAIIFGLRFYNLEQNGGPLVGIGNSFIYHRLFSRFINALWVGAVLQLVVALIILITLFLLKEKLMSTLKIKIVVAAVASILTVFLFGIAYFELGDTIGQRIAANAIAISAITDLIVLNASIFYYKLERPNIAAAASLQL